MLAQSLVPTLASRGAADDRARALLDGLLDMHRQIRLLSHGLVPVRVEAGGLHSALGEMARDWQQMHGTECIFVHEGQPDLDDERVATCLYRIAREAARNAVLHGAARLIVIRLVAGEDGIELEVRDDGQGMAEVPADGPGMGLQIMRHRAALVGGVLDIESAVDSGTVVRCRIAGNRAVSVGKQT
jgi:signal transduction histidine kinase